MARLCSTCGLEFSSFNPLRKLCDDCQEKRANPLALLAIADGDLEANIWVDVLQQAGIPAMVRQNDVLRGRFQTAPQPYSTEVLVNQRDLDSARELLDLDRK